MRLYQKSIQLRILLRNDYTNHWKLLTVYIIAY
nr:MAG TPA: protein of unknown function DUF4812 [Caudoviricetes sp.]